jgi:NAD+ diphosphatase
MPFGSVSIPRWSDHRSDVAWIEALVRDRQVRLLVIGADLRVLVDGDALGWCDLPDWIDPKALVLLGEVDGTASFAVDGVIAPSLMAGVENTRGVRDALGSLEIAEAAALLQATGIISWHRNHPFCSACGARSLSREAGHTRWCPSCGTTHFPRTDPAVIMLVTAGDTCILGQRQGSPTGRWSTLAGYVEPGESLEVAVAREVFEEVGVEVTGTIYVGSQPWPFPSSLMVAFEAPARRTDLVINDEHIAVRWFEREELRDASASGAVEVPGAIAAGGYLIRRWLG